MPAGLLQLTTAVNTVPIPNSCLLTIDNLSASTTRAAISKMAQQVGKVKVNIKVMEYYIFALMLLIVLSTLKEFPKVFSNCFYIFHNFGKI